MICSQFNSSLSLELHQRSCEFIYLLDGRWGDGLSHAFAKMPPVQTIALRGANDDSKVCKSRTDASSDSDLITQSASHMVSKHCDAPTQAMAPDLLDLANVPTEPRGAVDLTSQSSHVSDVDLLSDIFTTIPAIGEAVVINQGSTTSANAENCPAESIGPIKVLDKGGLMITMDLLKDPADSTSMHIACSFSNYTDRDFEKFLFQAAVPKYANMEMKSASSNCVPADSVGRVTQKIKVKNPCPDKALKMLLKVQYVVDDRLIIEHGQVPTFP